MSSVRNLRHAKRTVAVVAAAGLAFSLAACSSSSDSSSASGGGGDACTSPGVTDTEVKTGVVFPATGAAGPTFKGFDQGVKARLEAQNAEGGVNGRTISYVVADDAGDGAAQVTAAQGLVQNDEVFGVITASRVDTMLDYLQQENVPVTGAPLPPAYGQDNNVFGAWGAMSTEYYTSAYAERFKAAGVTKVAVLAHNSPGSLSGANSIIKTFESVGIEIAMTQFDIPLGTYDATSTAIRIRDSGADGLYTPLLTDSNISIARAIQQQGVELKSTYYSVIYDPEVVKQAGDVLDGAMTTPTGTKPLQVADEGIKAYEANLAKFAPEADPYTGFTTVGYLAADLFVKGLEEAGDCVDRATFIKNLRAVTDYEGAGLTTQTFAFTPGVTPNGDPQKCVWFATVENGAFVADDKVTCGELIKTA